MSVDSKLILSVWQKTVDSKGSRDKAGSPQDACRRTTSECRCAEQVVLGRFAQGMFIHNFQGNSIMSDFSLGSSSFVDTAHYSRRFSYSAFQNTGCDSTIPSLHDSSTGPGDVVGKRFLFRLRLCHRYPDEKLGRSDGHCGSVAETSSTSLGE